MDSSISAETLTITPSEITEQPATSNEEVTLVPLRALRLSSLNVRKSSVAGIAELAANIATVGVLQNLIVHVEQPSKGKGKKSAVPTICYGVVGGRRRLAALDHLRAEQIITDDYLVPVKIVSVEDAQLASMTENTQRQQMHVADLIMAFAALAQEGRSIAFIAGVFGQSELYVRQRLKLAKLSPELIAELRADRATIEQLQVLALLDDHESQNRAWFECSPWDRQVHALRRKIMGERVTFKNCLAARFIGLDAYEAAGGALVRDLFAEEDDAFLNDVELAERLALEKLKADIADLSLEEQGWAWLEVMPRYFARHEYRDLYEMSAEQTTPTEEQRERMAWLEERLEDIEVECDLLGEDEESQITYGILVKEHEELRLEYRRLQHGITTWAPEHRQHAGVVVSLSSNAQLQISYGLIRKEQLKDAVETGVRVVDHYGLVVGARSAKLEHATVSDKPARAIHSEKLVQRLSAHRCMATKAEMIIQPKFAVAILAHTLACNLLGLRSQSATATVRVNATRGWYELKAVAPEIAASEGGALLERERSELFSLFPPDWERSVEWLLGWEAEDIQRLLAYLTAESVCEIRTRDTASALRPIEKALSVNVRQYWQPTKEAYFDHISKASMVDIVTCEVSSEQAATLSAMKKPEAAAATALMMANTGWVPVTLQEKARNSEP